MVFEIVCVSSMLKTTVYKILFSRLYKTEIGNYQNRMLVFTVHDTIMVAELNYLLNIFHQCKTQIKSSLPAVFISLEALIFDIDNLCLPV